MRPPFALFLIPLAGNLLFLETLAAQDPYLVGGSNDGLNQLIEDGDDDPTDLFATDFGVVNLSEQEGRTFRIINSGNQPLQIGSISSSSSKFTFSPSAVENGGTLQVDSQIQFSIIYTADLGPTESLITITTNAPGSFGTFEFDIIGEGVSQIYVDHSATGANDGSSWADAFISLQDALAAAVADDQIRVAEGVYYPDEGVGQTDNDRNSSFVISESITIQGGYPTGGGSSASPESNLTVLSGDLQKNDPNLDGNFIAEDPSFILGDNAYHVVSFPVDLSSPVTLDGVIVTAGLANDENVTDATEGGGLFTKADLKLKLNRCQVIGNLSTFRGAGLFFMRITGDNTELTLTDCQFSNNHGTTEDTNVSGAGCFMVANQLVVRDSQFSGHSLVANSTTGSAVKRGLAIHSQGAGTSASVLIEDCEFSNNQSISPTTSTSVVAINSAEAIDINRCHFSGNTTGTSTWETVLLLENSPTITIRDSLFTGNAGDVITASGSQTFGITLLNTTIANNDGNSFQLGSSFTAGTWSLGNCIISGNSFSIDSSIYNQTSLIRSHSLVQGFTDDGDGNLDNDTDPQFVDARPATESPTTAGDYRLSASSPLLDAGLNTSTTSITDLDGNARVQDSNDDGTATIDIGAYETEFVFVPADSLAHITDLTRDPNTGTVTLTVEALQDRSFTIEYTTLLTDPVTASWDLASSVFLNAGSNTVILSEADYNGPQPKTFFRIQTLPILE